MFIYKQLKHLGENCLYLTDLCTSSLYLDAICDNIFITFKRFMNLNMNLLILLLMELFSPLSVSWVFCLFCCVLFDVVFNF